MQHSQKPYSVYSVYSVVIKSIRTLIPAIGNSLSAAIKNRLGEAVINGGEDGIRTHGTLLRLTSLAKKRFRPLSHFSLPETDQQNALRDKINPIFDEISDYFLTPRFCVPGDRLIVMILRT